MTVLFLFFILLRIKLLLRVVEDDDVVLNIESSVGQEQLD
jgi:hypothetical protein